MSSAACSTTKTTGRQKPWSCTSWILDLPYLHALGHSSPVIPLSPKYPDECVVRFGAAHFLPALVPTVEVTGMEHKLLYLQAIYLPRAPRWLAAEHSILHRWSTLFTVTQQRKFLHLSKEAPSWDQKLTSLHHFNHSWSCQVARYGTKILAGKEKFSEDTMLKLLTYSVIGSACIFVVGITQLALFVGFEKAIKFGLLPFIIPGIVKAMFTASSVQLFKRNIKWKE